MKISNCIFATTLFVNSQVHATMLRGNVAPTERELKPLVNAPTCEEVNSIFPKLYCLEDCSTQYWQCAGDVVAAADMPGGTNCIDGGFAEWGQCNQSERDERCDEIEALNADDKIMCTEDCSESYLACSNGKVIEMPMAEGTKCYRNGIVRTAAGHCVVQEEVISYFELMDACMNYPDLENCASTADASSPPYNGATFDDGTWYFMDKVWFSYISTYSEEYTWSDEYGWYNGKGWDVFINIRFGHDQEVGRSRSIIASLDYGTTQIYKWNQYDLVDGDEEDAHYNCEDSPPEDPVTKFLAQLIKNPAIIFGLGRGEFDIPDVEEKHNYTAQVMIPASELGNEYILSNGNNTEGNVSVLIQGENEDDEEDEGSEEANEPVLMPTFLFKNVIVYDEDFFNEDPNDEINIDDDGDDDEEEGVELIPDDGSDMPTAETMEEIRVLFDGYFNVTLNATICSEDFEQVYNNITDVVTPILNRGKLLAGTGENPDGTGESIEEGTEEGSDQLDPIARKLMKLTKSTGQEQRALRRDTIYDCEDDQVLVYHCCMQDVHFLTCSPIQSDEQCPVGTMSSSRCLETDIAKDVILEPHFLNDNVPMQLHTAEHLESMQADLNDFFEEEDISKMFGGSSRLLKWDDAPKQDEWVAQEEDDFTSEENFLPMTRGNITKWASSPIVNGTTETTPEKLWENYGDLFLGSGGGLPNVKDLLADLEDLDETLSGLYNFNTGLEEDMLSIFDLMVKVEKAEQDLKSIDRTLSTLDRVLQLVSIIKYVKPIAVPIRNAVKKTRVYGIKRALTMVKKMRGKVVTPYKPTLKRVLSKNEEVRGVVAKSKFLNQNLMMNPFNTTRNCGTSDDAAKLISNVVDFAVVDTSGALDELEEFHESMRKVVRDLSGVINLVDDMVDAIEKTAKAANPIEKVLNPFYKALSTKITIPIVGPFCSKTVRISVPYPCGIKKCKKCRRIFRKKRCIRYPCGVKRCSFTKNVKLPTFCKKKFSFTVNQVLNGISGVMDIIFYPINKATDALLAAIPLPDIPLLPAFPTNFDVLNKMDLIGDILSGPTFPTDLLDFPSIDLALPGLNDIVCGKTASELYSVLELAKNGDMTPEFVREFYDGCGGFQDINPTCSSTAELLCGDGRCESEE